MSCWRFDEEGWLRVTMMWCVGTPGGGTCVSGGGLCMGEVPPIRNADDELRPRYGTLGKPLMC